MNELNAPKSTDKNKKHALKSESVSRKSASSAKLKQKLVKRSVGQSRRPSE